MNIFASMFTEVDNRTHDLFKYLSCLTVLVALGLTCYEVISNGTAFDIQAFGIGMGAVLAGAGAALLMKKDSPIA